MEIIKELKKLIADKTGVELTEIKKDSYFMEDLNVGEMELLEILEELEDKYEVDLSEKKDYIETFGDLLDILSEALE